MVRVTEQIPWDSAVNVFLISSGLQDKHSVVCVKVEVMVWKELLARGDLLLPVEKILNMLADRSNKLTRGPLSNFVIVNWFMFLRVNVVFLI